MTVGWLLSTWDSIHPLPFRHPPSNSFCLAWLKRADPPPWGRRAECGSDITCMRFLPMWTPGAHQKQFYPTMYCSCEHTHRYSYVMLYEALVLLQPFRAVWDIGTVTVMSCAWGIGTVTAMSCCMRHWYCYSHVLCIRHCTVTAMSWCLRYCTVIAISWCMRHCTVTAMSWCLRHCTVTAMSWCLRHCTVTAMSWRLRHCTVTAMSWL